MQGRGLETCDYKSGGNASGVFLVPSALCHWPTTDSVMMATPPPTISSTTTTTTKTSTTSSSKVSPSENWSGLGRPQVDEIGHTRLMAKKSDVISSGL